PLAERELIGQQEWEDIEQRRVLQADIPQTTRKALVSARIGQGLFKERVSRLERACRITFVENPAHLIASHIKPWRESTKRGAPARSQRLDVYTQCRSPFRPRIH